MSELYWITGASSGIGRGLALKAAARGCRVAASARNEEALAALAEEANGSIVPYTLDVTDVEACRAVVERIESDHGLIAHAVLNAGTHMPTPATDFQAEQVGTLVQVNLMGVVNCLDPLLKRFVERGAGHLAIMASVAGYRGLPMAGGYCATKAGLIALAESLHAELQPRGIKTQVICPGFVRTPLTDRNEFEMPHLMELDDAVDRLWEGLNSDDFEVAFPRRLAWQLKMMQKLPNAAYFPMIRKATGL